VTLGPGAQQVSLNVALNNDGLYEGDEDFGSVLTGNPASVIFSVPEAIATILDDECKQKTHFGYIYI